MNHEEYSRGSYPANKIILKTVSGARGHLLCRVYWASNLKDGVCRMGLYRLGQEIGCSKSTAGAAAAWLVKNDYIFKVREANPQVSQPAHFIVTSKFWDLLDTPVRNSDTPVRNSDTPVRNSDTPVRNSDEDIETDIETDINNTYNNSDHSKRLFFLSEDFSTITTLWQNNVGALSPLLADKIKAIISEMPEGLRVGWFTRAIEIAVSENVRKFSYVEAILHRWIADGAITEKIEHNKGVENYGRTEKSRTGGDARREETRDERMERWQRELRSSSDS